MVGQILFILSVKEFRQYRSLPGKCGDSGSKNESQTQNDSFLKSGSNNFD
jgi:hypothetical protein